MSVVAFAAVMVVAHAAVILLAVRRYRLSEGLVGLCHVVSFAALAIVALFAWLAWQAISFPHALAAICLHAIYSMSWLELWALSQGSFSLRLLAVIAESGGIGRGQLVERFRDLGASKKRQRLRSLISLGLIRKCDGVFVLTTRGRVVAAMLSPVRSPGQLG